YAFITTYASGNAADPGVDRVVMDAAQVDYLWINQGAGADTATLRDMDLKSLSMNTGGGDDDAAISFCHCDSLTANLGAGDDSLLLFETTAGSTLAYGGAGIDRLNRSGFSSTSVRVYDWEYFNGRPAAIYAPNLPSTSTTFSTR
ncbi:MAG: hypothetical protein KDB14_17945, partial [Planctomycetales bacterium]|nr:hypothetical protein [Planctomycetales bacterium]